MNQQAIEGSILQVYLVDDGSTDGTREAIQNQCPSVKVIQGDGSLYWCGGMRLAWSEAMKGDYDHYLWLNDDIRLFPGALKTLLQSANEIRNREGCDGIIVGSTLDPASGNRSYGGLLQNKKSRFIEPADHLQACDTMNGNIVLVPKGVALKVGILSSDFTHAIGDVDYGLRAKKQNISIWVAPGYHGTCKTNPGKQWTMPQTSFRDRWRILHSPKGLPPKEYMVFLRRHKKFFWPIEMFKLYLRVVFPQIWISSNRFNPKFW